MAIIPSLPGLEVEVCVNNTPLREYEDDDPDPSLGRATDKSVSRYVEARTDQDFVVRFRIQEDFAGDCPVLAFSTDVDGIHLHSTRLRAESSGRRKRSLEKECATVRSYDPISGQAVYRTLRFSVINTSTDEEKSHSIKEDIKQVSKVGLISVQVFRESESYVVTRSRRHNRPSKIWERTVTDVHEKVLKGDAKSHSVSFGPANTVNEPRTESNTRMISDRLDGSTPLAEFHFKYHSLEALKQLLIIGRTPEPNVKPESQNSLDSDKSQRGPKRERNDDEVIFMSQRQSKKFKGRMIIDLTEDD